MKFEEKDLKLSSTYHKALEDSKEIGKKQLEKYKRKNSTKIEIGLLLQNKDFVHNMTLNIGNKTRYEVLFTYFLNNFNISKKELSRLLRKNSIYRVTPNNIPFIILFIAISASAVFFLQPGVIHFLSIVATALLCGFLVIYLLFLFSSE